MKMQYEFTSKQKKLLHKKIIEFYNLVKEHSVGSFENFVDSDFIGPRENYKYDTIKKTREKIANIVSCENFGNGEIRKLLIDAIDDGFNLVNSFWRNNVKGAICDLEGSQLKKFEKNLHDLYSDKMSAKDFFNYYTSEVSGIYNIVAYILFLKDSTKYLTIATKRFDDFFKEIELDFKTTAHCSWENYSEYLDILSTIRCILKETLNMKISLIDAHSFVWVCEDPSLVNWRQEQKEESPVEKKYTKTVIDARHGQGLFRNRVIKKWNGKSSVSNFNKIELMKAAHIKPWKYCNEKECVDSDNGLLLTPNIDLLFDYGKGYITFDDNGNVIFSSRLTADIIKEFGISKDLKLKEVNDKTKEYLRWHREHVFKP